MTRLVILAAAALLALGAVAGMALFSLDRVADSNVLLADAQAILSQQQAADMSHDEMRSDVLTVLASTGAERTQAERDVTQVAQTLRVGLTGQDARLAAWHRPSISREFAATQMILNNYAASGVQVAAVAGDPVAARRAFASFDTQFVLARDRMALLTTDLRSAAAETRAGAARAARQGRQRTEGVAGAALLVLLGLTARVWRSVGISLHAKREAECALTRANSQLTHDAARQQVQVALKDAFAVAATEAESQEVVRRAVRELASGHRAELLLADNSRAHLRRTITEPAGDAPGCGVLTPADCMAVRSGRTEVFDNVDGIRACPKLTGRGDEVGRAICAPVTFLGEGLGVLHVVCAPGATFDADTAQGLGLTADQAGNRIGTLRAFARSQLQANTDGLTGLLNRRAAEHRFRELQTAGRIAAVALCDLDHFKSVNDTFGHEMGDRALRIFSATLQAVMRSEDIVARYGGEEFLLVMPGCDLRTAEAVLDRIRSELSLALTGGGTPIFTASFGVTDGPIEQPLDQIVARADAALMRAKQDGRDRIVAMPAAATNVQGG